MTSILLCMIAHLSMSHTGALGKAITAPVAETVTGTVPEAAAGARIHVCCCLTCVETRLEPEEEGSYNDPDSKAEAVPGDQSGRPSLWGGEKRLFLGTSGFRRRQEMVCFLDEKLFPHITAVSRRSV